MTVIAWDGQTLAADRQSTFGGTPARTKKVFRVRRRETGEVVLFGCAGDTGCCQAYARWARGEGERPPTLRNLLIMAIDEKGRIWCAQEDLNWYRIGAKFWALGSGANYALAAMACNRGAVAAVKIAQRFDVNCGFGVDSVRFR